MALSAPAIDLQILAWLLHLCARYYRVQFRPDIFHKSSRKVTVCMQDMQPMYVLGVYKARWGNRKR